MQQMTKRDKIFFRLKKKNVFRTIFLGTPGAPKYEESGANNSFPKCIILKRKLIFKSLFKQKLRKKFITVSSEY